MSRLDKNKKAQFYLITAAIIVAILIGFAIVFNSSTTTSDKELKYLKKEIDLEIGSLFENLASETEEGIISFRLSGFSDIYIDKSKNKNSFFLFGDENSITIKGKRIDGAKTLYINIGEGYQPIEVIDYEFSQTFPTPVSPVLVRDGEEGEIEYNLQILKGQNLYYIISKEYQGEKQVIMG